MRPQTVKTVRIRTSETRNDSGSVSPPALGDGKTIFVQKMHKMYGNLDPSQLELKIEQLWNGLNSSQREKFIGKSGEKENFSSKTPRSTKKKTAPALETQINKFSDCKAIAKVLDLKTSKPGVSYAQVVKGKMQAYWKEGKHISSRFGPPSPPSGIYQFPTPPKDELNIPTIQIEIPSTNPLDSTPFIAEIPRGILEKPKNSMKTLKLESIFKKSVNIPPMSSKTPRRIQMKKTTTTVMKSMAPTPQPPVKRISYDDACREYYSTLSQAFLMDSEPLDTSMLSTYASILQGYRPIREYNALQNL
ncbi:hypothetical protein CRE_05902 [Caenorhabditis remanei]|uniref:Uncharacterized protein n=1 Tax=Caenorhabditis remanei TaxID=31234 RepID=E3MNN9_CAERE|nr:hypothetical protein CRE_05902 [Caenorhabditis remanei]